MAIHIQEEQNLQQGHLKSIDEAGIMMVFDTLQKYQYAHPIKSVVREILSNGVDSVAEKKVAIEILTGKAKVEDYFVDLEGALYKDSRFDPTYYDLKWLSKDNTVSMTYQVGGVMEKDKVIFKDYGVGLFGKRLEGYFKLAYSTKRLSKLPIGKFGLGAKSPLSLGIDHYTVESRYNGMLFRFNIYSQKVDSIIPKMDLASGRENQSIILGEGTEHAYPVYWVPTEEKNGLTVIVESKKHHKNQYLDAVKSQMLYFDGIRLVEEIGGIRTEVPYKAHILYEDDLIVLSENTYYSKPHLLLNKVSYGYIDWNELELEEKQGNIGIKVAPEDVEVNPSRESVLWTDKTKNKVLTRFNEVVDIAARMIQEELQATDILQWLKTCYSVYSKFSSRDGIVGRLAKIVDLSRAKFKFVPDERIVFNSKEPLPGFFIRDVTVVDEREANRVMKRKVIRSETTGLAYVLGKPVFLMKSGERASNRRDKWLYKQYPTGFVTIMEPYITFEQAEKAGATEQEIKKLYADNTSPETRRVLWEFIQAAEGVTWYDSIEVPEDFTGTEQDVEETEVKEEQVEQVKQVQVAKQTAEERRKLTGKTLVDMLVPFGSKYTVFQVDAPGQKRSVQQIYSFYKQEIPIASINDWKAKEVYYGFEEDKELIQFVAMLTRDPATDNTPCNPIRRHAKDFEVWTSMKWWRLNQEFVKKTEIPAVRAYTMQHFFDTDVMLVKVSKATAKYYRDFSRIQEFFIQIENKTITMSNQLIKWNTARLIRDKLATCSFLYNFPFNQEFSDMYHELCNFADKHYREVEKYSNGDYYGLRPETYQDMLEHLDKVHQFQNFVTNAPNDHEGIGKLAGQLFGNKELRDGMAVDPEIMRKLGEVIDYAQACGPMLNFIPVLTGIVSTVPDLTYRAIGDRSPVRSIPEELEHELRNFLDARGLLDTRTSTGVLEDHLQHVHETETDLALQETS